jgi:predicted nucleic acid-binding protein
VILADTSLWIDHLRFEDRELSALLRQGQIAIHPFIVAELALGSFRDCGNTLALLDFLPHVRVAHLNEVRLMVENRRLYGLGIGLVDAHLIASVFLDTSTRLWTRDKRLRKVAESLGIHTSLS